MGSLEGLGRVEEALLLSREDLLGSKGAFTLPPDHLCPGLTKDHVFFPTLRSSWSKLSVGSKGRGPWGRLQAAHLFQWEQKLGLNREIQGVWVTLLLLWPNAMTKAAYQQKCWFGLRVLEGGIRVLHHGGEASQWEQEAGRSHPQSQAQSRKRDQEALLWEMYFLQSSCTTYTSPNSANNPLPSIQIPKPMGDVSHSNYHERLTRQNLEHWGTWLRNMTKLDREEEGQGSG